MTVERVYDEMRVDRWNDPPEPDYDRPTRAEAELDEVAEERSYARDDPRHPAARITLDVDEPSIDSQWDTEP